MRGRGRRRVAGQPPRLDPSESVLLVAVGNDLRGDDAVGPLVARALDGRLPWRVIVAHGLTPELADDLAACDHVIVVDAHADAGLLRPTWRPVIVAPPAPTGAAQSPFAHALDLTGLLALTMTLHGRAPRATLMAMPARDFALGETLSLRAAAGVDMATAALVALARRRTPPRLTT